MLQVYRIVARAEFAGQHRRWISGAPVQQVQIRIVSAGHPGHAAGGRVGSSDGRSAVPLPLRLAGFRIEGAQIAGEIIEVARDADDHVIAARSRATWWSSSLSWNRPTARSSARFPSLAFKRDQVRIGSRVEEPVPIHRDAAMADVKALVGRIGVMPDLVARARIDRPDVIRDS